MGNSFVRISRIGGVFTEFILYIIELKLESYCEATPPPPAYVELSSR